MPKNHELLLGAHMSIAGGFQMALERGQSIGCTAIQIFTKSARTWQAKEITDEQAQLFISSKRQSSIKYVMVHASYLINLAASDPDGLQKSIDATCIELKRCQQLEIPYLVLHPGTYGSQPIQETLDGIVASLDAIFKQVPGNSMILLENTAGQGSSLCSTFEQIAYILKKNTHKKRLGTCFDTCHAFAAGYDFTTSDTYNDMIQKFDDTIGLEHLKAFHINDCKLGLGAKKDRHEEIGKGKIDLKAFDLIFNDSRFFDIPKVLETPNDTLPGYRDNMDVITKLLTDKTKKELNIKE